MEKQEQERLVEATQWAHLWHQSQSRKGTKIPYVSHLLQVQGLVLEHGGNADQAIAALLHDGLEDAPTADERAVREREIGERFGSAVLEIVGDCTDTLAHEFLDEKGCWKERKTRYIERLAGASRRTQLVAACDKRHNLHAIVWDVEIHGPEVFERFTGSPDQQIWYFSSIIEKLGDRIPRRLARELEELLARLRHLVDALDS